MLERACPTDGELAAFAHGRVAGPLLDRLAGHLTGCPTCHQRLEHPERTPHPVVRLLRHAPTQDWYRASSAAAPASGPAPDCADGSGERHPPRVLPLAAPGLGGPRRRNSLAVVAPLRRLRLHCSLVCGLEPNLSAGWLEPKAMRTLNQNGTASEDACFFPALCFFLPCCLRRRRSALISAADCVLYTSSRVSQPRRATSTP